jgi:hypothetical protein
MKMVPDRHLGDVEAASDLTPALPEQRELGHLELPLAQSKRGKCVADRLRGIEIATQRLDGPAQGLADGVRLPQSAIHDLAVGKQDPQMSDKRIVPQGRQKKDWLLGLLAYGRREPVGVGDTEDEQLESDAVVEVVKKSWETHYTGGKPLAFQHQANPLPHE